MSVYNKSQSVFVSISNMMLALSIERWILGFSTRFTYFIHILVVLFKLSLESILGEIILLVLDLTKILFIEVLKVILYMSTTLAFEMKQRKTKHILNKSRSSSMLRSRSSTYLIRRRSIH